MPKILLIEDDTNLAFMIADGMEGEGFETKTFASAEEALPAFLEFRPDIVFTDVNLKGEMDGFELARRIRNLSNTPVIFITSRTQVEDLKKGYEIREYRLPEKTFRHQRAPPSNQRAAFAHPNNAEPLPFGVYRPVFIFELRATAVHQRGENTPQSNRNQDFGYSQPKEKRRGEQT